MESILVTLTKGVLNYIHKPTHNDDDDDVLGVDISIASLILIFVFQGRETGG